MIARAGIKNFCRGRRHAANSEHPESLIYISGQKRKTGHRDATAHQSTAANQITKNRDAMHLGFAVYE